MVKKTHFLEMSLSCSDDPRLDGRLGFGLRACPEGYEPAIAASIALGKRVSKSKSPTHVGRTEIRAIWANIARTCSTQARPCSSPKYRSAAAAYSGVTPSTLSTLAIPRINNTLCGKELLSIVSATCAWSGSTITLGALGGE